MTAALIFNVFDRISLFLVWSMNNMIALRRSLTLLAALVLVAVGASSVRAQGIPFDLPDLGGREVSAVTSNDYPPLSLVDTDSGDSIGFEYEIWGEICKRLNCVLNWNVMAWPASFEAVAGGQFDVGMDGITITEERAQQVDFSAPYLTVEQQFLVRSDEDRFATVAEMVANEEIRFGSTEGSFNYLTVLELVGEENADRIVTFSSFALAVQALVSGDVDAILTDAAAGRGYIGANAGALVLLDEVFSSDELGFIFPQDSDLVDPVNAALESMIYDGYLAYLENKWFYIYANQ
jgi:ABC-type amino acid transport substrate-binding protein